MRRFPHLSRPVSRVFQAVLCLVPLMGIQMLGAHKADAQFDRAPRSFGRGSIESLVLSPDAERVITSGSDGIYVYDVASLADLAHLRRQSGPFHRDTNPVFSPDSRWLAMNYADTTVVVWDMESFSEIVSLAGHVDWVTAMVFSDDNSLLATGDRTGRMKVWSTADWSLVAEGRSEWVRELVFQGVGRLVASNGFRAIRVWRLPDFVEEELLVHDDNVGILKVFSDERRLISGAADGTARLWDLNSGESLGIMPQPGNRTARVLVSPDEQYAVLHNSSSSYAGTHVWSLDPLEEIAVFGYPDSGPLGISGDSQHLLMWRVRDEEEGNLIGFWNFAAREFVDSVRVDQSGRSAFDADALQLTMVSTTGTMQKHDLITATVTSRPLSYLQHVDDIAFSPGGEWLAAAFSRSVHIWDTITGSLLLTMNSETSIDHIDFSADCRYVYAEHSRGLVRRSVEDPSSSELIYDGFITAIDFAPSVERAALGWHQGDAAVIDLHRGTTISSFAGHADDLSTIALSDDGSLMAVSGEWRDEPEAWLWQVNGEQLLGRLPARRAGVAAFDFTSDNRLLAASGWYDGIHLWDVESLTLVDSLETLSRSEALAFSPDDEWLAWIDPGIEPLRLLDIASGERVVAAPGQARFSGEVLIYSPDGSRIAMGGFAGRVWVWETVDAAHDAADSPCTDLELPSREDGMTDTVVLVPDDVAAPMAVNLEPSQPNPTFTRTAISFDVPAHARVRLEVFNIQGQLTRVLVDTEMDLGRYRQGWDGRDEAGRAVASGVYLIRLQVGDQVRHGKLMRVR